MVVYSGKEQKPYWPRVTTFSHVLSAQLCGIEKQPTQRLVADCEPLSPPLLLCDLASSALSLCAIALDA